MILQVLPGDAYVEVFAETGIEGEIVVCRECFVEGDLRGETLQQLWKTRERYLSGAYPAESKSYEADVASELEKLHQAGEGDEVNLWFEYELFCSVNYWFCLYLLRDSNADVHRVAPTVRDDETKWRGFGKLAAGEMIACWNDRVKLTAEHIKHGADLWLAFRSANHERLMTLGTYESPAFPYLQEVCEAAAGKDTKPQQILREIAAGGKHDFDEVFAEFSQRAGVFGLGDVQVKRLMRDVR